MRHRKRHRRTKWAMELRWYLAAKLAVERLAQETHEWLNAKPVGNEWGAE